jgi:hypothetical protein
MTFATFGVNVMIFTDEQALSVAMASLQLQVVIAGADNVVDLQRCVGLDVAKTHQIPLPWGPQVRLGSSALVITQAYWRMRRRASARLKVGSSATIRKPM